MFVRPSVRPPVYLAARLSAIDMAAGEVCGPLTDGLRSPSMSADRRWWCIEHPAPIVKRRAASGERQQQVGAAGLRLDRRTKESIISLILSLKLSRRLRLRRLLFSRSSFRPPRGLKQAPLPPTTTTTMMKMMTTVERRSPLAGD